MRRRTNIQGIPTPTKWIGGKEYDPEIFEDAFAGASIVSGSLDTVTVAADPVSDSQNVAGVSLASGALLAAAVDAVAGDPDSFAGVSLASGSLDSVVVDGDPAGEIPTLGAALVSGSLEEVVVNGGTTEEANNVAGVALLSGSLDTV